MKLTDKTVFITGAARGIGAAFARAVLEKGANVIIADVNDAKGSELADEFKKEFGNEKAAFINCDVSSYTAFKDAFQTAIDKYKQIDVMVNNAGIANEKDLEKLFHTNLKGVMVGTELALGHMRKDKGGQGGVIINVASVAGFTPIYSAPAYAASKHAVIGYTRSLAVAPDLRKQAVRYACMCPGLVDTTLTRNIQPDASREGYYEQVRAGVQNAKMIKPETVAEGLLSLIDDDDSNDVLQVISRTEGIVRKKITVTTDRA